ncbi:MAG: hypothetical protein LBJ00_04265 [Planctomycetaceae bacterium]|jgi:hypothetical protein|nr:hypothetical protein [Planctomycetaceae bacterium]
MSFLQRFTEFSLVVMFVSGTISIVEEIDIFQTAKKYDTVYEKGVFTSGFHKSLSPPLFMGQDHDKLSEYDWQFTQSGKKKALLEVLKNVPKQDNA